jgi:hypothetical protein
MTCWRPTQSEPDPLRAALYDYLRGRAAQAFLKPQNEKQTLGRTMTTMSNGQSLTIDIALMPAEVTQFAGRSAIAYLVSGHAAEAGVGYQVDGRVVIDRQTLAFLQIEAVPMVLRRR